MVCDGLVLEDVLYDIYYLAQYSNMSPEYVENLTPFEREFFIAALLKKIEDETNDREKAVS